MLMARLRKGENKARYFEFLIDSGADFIVVDNDQDFYLLDSNRKNMERVIGREISIPVLHINELENLAIGEHDIARTTLKNHAIDPQII